MKRIEKIIAGGTAPIYNDDLWLDTSDINKPQLKMLSNGTYKNVGGGSASPLLEITRVPDENYLWTLTPEEIDQILIGQTLSLRMIDPTYPIQEQAGVEYHPRILRTNVDTVGDAIYAALEEDMADELNERGITEFGDMWFFGSIQPTKVDDDIINIDSCDLFVVFETGDPDEPIYKVATVER